MQSLRRAMAFSRPTLARLSPLAPPPQVRFAAPQTPAKRLLTALKCHPAGTVLLLRHFTTGSTSPGPFRGPKQGNPNPQTGGPKASFGPKTFAPRKTGGPDAASGPDGGRPPRGGPRQTGAFGAQGGRPPFGGPGRGGPPRDRRGAPPPAANAPAGDDAAESQTDAEYTIDDNERADFHFEGAEVIDEKKEADRALQKREIKKSEHVHTADWERFYDLPKVIPEVEAQLKDEFTAKQLRNVKKTTAELKEMLDLVDHFDDDDLNILFGAYVDVDDPNVREMFEIRKLEEYAQEELEKEALAAKDPATAVKESLEKEQMAEISALEAQLAKLVAAEKTYKHSPLDFSLEPKDVEMEFTEEEEKIFTDDLVGDDYYVSYDVIPEAEVEERSVAHWTDKEEADVDVDHELDTWEANPDISEEQKDWDALFLDLHSPYDAANKLQVKPKIAAIMDNLIKQNIERHHIETVEEIVRGPKEPERSAVDVRELDPEEPYYYEDPWSTEPDDWAEANPQDEYDDVPDDYGVPPPALSPLDAAMEAKRRIETFGVVKRPEMKDFDTPDGRYQHRVLNFGTMRDEAPFLTEVDDNYQHDQWEELLLRKRLDPFNRDFYVPEHSFVLSDVAKETIFLLNLWEPEKWGYRELARTFSIETDRVRAIIRLKRMEHYRRHHGLLYQDFDPEEDSGVLTYWDPVFHPFHYGDVNERLVSDFAAISERADDDRYWKRIANYKAPPRDPTLPAPDGKLTDKHLPVQRKNRFPLVISDISKKGENLVVKVRQTNGAIRNSIDEELVRGIQIENPWHKDRQRTMRRGGNYW